MAKTRRRKTPATLPPRHLAIRIIMLPRDTNGMGTIFGGAILAHLDLAGAVEAQRQAAQEFVTVAMKEVVFVAPVFVGDVVNFYTRTTRVGRTSITIQVEVEAERLQQGGGPVKVTEAEITFVAVDRARRPTPLLLRPEAAASRP